ncbi:MAG: hypothetical protein HRU20_28280 [Pseudomonadales bacterium]|nr:hypothetical protein [Pseudomonadales bacterium]
MEDSSITKVASVAKDITVESVSLDRYREVNFFRLNEKGDVLSGSYDSDGDGVPNEYHSYTYDEKGRLLTYKDESFDAKIEGPSYPSSSYSYDINLKRFAWGPYLSKRYYATVFDSYIYDDSGYQLTSCMDEDGDDVAERGSIKTYDNYGNPLTTAVDSDGDGRPDSISSYSYKYDGNGNMLLSIVDIDGDGETDEVNTYTYDDNENLLTHSIGKNESQPVWIWLYTYDDKGKQLSPQLDSNADGIVDDRVSYTFDDNGNISTESFYFDNDEDEFPNRFYSYDAKGNILSQHTGYNADGVIRSISYYSYDANNNMLSHINYLEDGNINYIFTYSYDSNGYESSYSEDFGGDGTIEINTTSTFDSNGNQLTYVTPNSNTVIDYKDAK